ncbi:hypothetical protein GLW08_04350 [Pontibacillus yanchengensis]|uniref:Uncharacterized protein n=2 Tax=Pontibacillus yanchengensis TaxID=462910 RepID=A0ACC7VEF0_9BACI|nr:hypothetical protein [Pontibacillus yanchengensis]MYL31987.1 hypothetical protein [Pontibacillus yanchengensis]MYL52564.1 hypothetical protein [Pontibacillus yanchengensis]
MYQRNRIATILQVIGIVFFLMGIIIAFIVKSILFFYLSFVVLMLFLGFAEVIHLLQKIHLDLIRYTRGEEFVEQKQSPEVQEGHFYTIHPLTDKDKQKVHELFEDTPAKHLKLIHTPYEHVCIVHNKSSYSVVRVTEQQASVVPVKELETSNPGLIKWSEERKGIRLDGGEKNEEL